MSCFLLSEVVRQRASHGVTFVLSAARSIVYCILTSSSHAVVVKANAKDILKKSTTRKNR